jgi:hypothetical protein
MFEPVAQTVVASLFSVQQVRVWAVFLLCLFFSAIGVVINFLVFGSKITGVRFWGVGFVISVAMLGLSYGAKYANPDARESFTPVDLIQYLSQGFLWPSTWPALADLLGVQKIQPPVQSSMLWFNSNVFDVTMWF